ncbi:HisA/HisF-related TIM barrel protein [Colwellia psychrerythraea]|uniref:Histidine biosynthesis protein n=1 Tax=Colwellia psychrerythraea TaxID=28229 RepID=A0A099L3I6_COLPS|nr:HisA/HisF-related TIM barrel protein [Colwellia psychrerythraea]KGJ97005.1 histidine biosynthesis protein [Colwellia psychrerythraea]
MRTGATILLKDGLCYQSYQWNIMRPLGSLQNVIDSLEEYQCDEIAIIRPVRQNDNREALNLDLMLLQQINTMTPISFGGGIRVAEDLNLLTNLPVERLIFSSIFINKNTNLLNHACNLYGHQAIQCLLPVRYTHGNLDIFNCQQGTYIPLRDIDFDYINRHANEVILFDTQNEGLHDKFEKDIIKVMPLDKSKLIISGGISHGVIKWAKEIKLACALIDNKVLHQEYSIKSYKHA